MLPSRIKISIIILCAYTEIQSNQNKTYVIEEGEAIMPEVL